VPGAQDRLPQYLSPHADDLTPGPRSVLLPFSSRPTSAFPTNVKGRRVSRTTRFIPQTGSPSYVRLLSSHEAASFVFVLRPVGLASTPDWVRRTLRLSRHIVGASSAEMLPSKRAPSLHARKGNWRD